MERASIRWLVVALVGLAGLVVGLVLGGLFGGLAGYLLGRGSLPPVGAEAEATPTPPPVVQALPWEWPFCPPCPEVTPEIPEETPPGMWGARVERVLPGSPAEKAGLRVGDVILEVDGRRITPGRSLADLIARYRPGDEVRLTVRRGNETLQVTVRLGEHPERPGQAYLGISFRPSWP